MAGDRPGGTTTRGFSLKGSRTRSVADVDEASVLRLEKIPEKGENRKQSHMTVQWTMEVGMSDTFSKIEEGILELFPETEDMDITPDMELGGIPDWDSMAAVNLQGFLEQAFQIVVPLDLLDEESTIREVISFVEEEYAYEIENPLN